MSKIEQLCHEMQKAHQRSSWREIGKQYGISGGLAYRIAHGYEPKDLFIRHRLGLPAYALAPVCPRCSEVHVTRRCTRHRRAYRALIDMPVDVLSWKVEHREDYAD